MIAARGPNGSARPIISAALSAAGRYLQTGEMMPVLGSEALKRIRGGGLTLGLGVYDTKAIQHTEITV